MINTSPLLNYVSSNHDIKAINQWRSDVENQLQESFDHGQSIRDVILTRSNMIDEALIFLWKYAKLDQTDLSLFAVGGYGRREMLPYSDVDIMILSEDEFSEEQEKLISVFISSLWDVGNFKPGISVRTIANCVEQATSDLTVATALIESRLITGNEHLAKWHVHEYRNYLGRHFSGYCKFCFTLWPILRHSKTPARFTKARCSMVKDCIGFNWYCGDQFNACGCNFATTVSYTQ